MARTFISQPNQIFRSEGYNDNLTPGITLQTSADTLAYDLNAIRTQIKQIIWGPEPGSWYDVLINPSGSVKGINNINVSLSELEKKKFLYSRQILNLVEIATGSNIALLSASLGNVPIKVVTTDSVNTGVIAAQFFPTTYNISAIDLPTNNSVASNLEAKLSPSNSNFTLEFWAKVISSPVGGVPGHKTPIVVLEGYDQSYIGIHYDPDFHAPPGPNFPGHEIAFFDDYGSVSSNVVPSDLYVGQWVHYALVRDDDYLKLFVSGNFVCETFIDNWQINETMKIKIGSATAEWAAGTNMPMLFDELRYTVGEAIYTASYDPQKIYYTPEANTNLLLHFDGIFGTNLVIDSAANPINLYSPIGSKFVSDSPVAFLPLQANYYGRHSLAFITGSSTIRPKNLCSIRDAFTHDAITTSLGGGQTIYALLQVESGTSGFLINDIDKRAQLSFIYETPEGIFMPAPGPEIGGRIINYSYNVRDEFINLPEDASLSDVSGTELPDIPKFQLSDVTLQLAFENQNGNVAVAKNTNFVISNNSSFSILDHSGQKIAFSAYNENTSSFTIKLQPDDLLINTVNSTLFASGIIVSTSTLPVEINHGAVTSISSSLKLKSSDSNLYLADKWSQYSLDMKQGIMLTDDKDGPNHSLQWVTYEKEFGQNVSLIRALNSITQSLSGVISNRRVRYNAGAKMLIPANVNVTYPDNLDAPLGDYSGKVFATDVEIYFNGILLQPGNINDKSDVYPGNSPSTGDIKFPFKVRSGSQITMLRY